MPGEVLQTRAGLLRGLGMKRVIDAARWLLEALLSALAVLISGAAVFGLFFGSWQHGFMELVIAAAVWSVVYWLRKGRLLKNPSMT